MSDIVQITEKDLHQTPEQIEGHWLAWAKYAWMEQGPEAGASVLAYYVALRDGMATV